MRRIVVVGLLLAVASLVLGATAFRAQAAAAVQAIIPVLVTNDAANPVRVHEQGTANVNVSGGTVNVGSTPLATAHRSGGGSCGGSGECSGSSGFSPMIASSIVLTAETSGATFTFKNGGTTDPNTGQYTGGSVVYRVSVAADTTTVIPLHDRILVDHVADHCDNGCSVSFSLLGQNAS